MNDVSLVLLGALVSGVFGIAGYFVRFLFERSRLNAEEKRAGKIRAEAAEIARVEYEESHGLELKPAIGHGWWLVRHHQPSIKIQHLQIWDADGHSRDTSQNFVSGMEVTVGTGYGLGIDIFVGDYVEIHWTEEDRACQDGTRISNPEESYWLRKDGAGH